MQSTPTNASSAAELLEQLKRQLAAPLAVSDQLNQFQNAVAAYENKLQYAELKIRVLPTGETRTFLEDQDEIILRGYCQREGAARIGAGECRGTVSG